MPRLLKIFSIWRLRPNAEHQQSVYGIGGTNQEVADLLQMGMRVVPIQMLLGASYKSSPARWRWSRRWLPRRR